MQSRSSTSTLKTDDKNSVQVENDNRKDIDVIESISNDEKIAAIDNIRNIDIIDNSGNIENNVNENYISLYKQSELQDIDDNINYMDNNSANKENNFPVKRDDNYISLYTQSDKDIDDTNSVVSKSNSFTLGEVRQALNNGLLDKILPMGPLYRVNGSEDKSNIGFSDNNVVESNEIQVNNSFK